MNLCMTFEDRTTADRACALLKQQPGCESPTVDYNEKNAVVSCTWRAPEDLAQCLCLLLAEHVHHEALVGRASSMTQYPYSSIPG